MFMTSKEIKIELFRWDVKQTELAKKIGITQGFLNQVISRFRRTHWIRKEIARAIGKPYKEVWPEEFENNNQKPMNHAGFRAAPDHVGSRARKAA